MSDSDTEHLKAEIVVECGMGCGWTTKMTWSNRIDGVPGQEGDTPPEAGNVLEGELDD